MHRGLPNKFGSLKTYLTKPTPSSRRIAWKTASVAAMRAYAGCKPAMARCKVRLAALLQVYFAFAVGSRVVVVTT